MPAQGAIWRVTFTGPDSIAAGRGTEIHRWRLALDPGLELFQPMLSQPETGVEALEKQSRLETCLDEAGKRLAGGRVNDAVAGLRAFQEEPGFAHNDELLSMLARCGRYGRRTVLREWWRRAIFKLGEYEGLGGVMAVRFSPDGGTLAAGQYEGTIGIYNAATGTTRKVLERLIGPVLAFVFLAEDDLLALSKNGDLVRWDLASGSGQAIRTGLDPNDGAHLSAVLAEDGRYMAVLGMKGYNMYTVRLGDAAPIGIREFSPRVLRAKFDLGIPNVMEETYAGYDYKAAVSPDSRFYSTSIMNTKFGPGAHPVYVWEVRQGGIALAQTLLGHTSPVLTMAFSPAGDALISADINGLLRLWGLPGGNCLREIRQPGSQFTSVAFSADGRRILAGDSEGSLFLWGTDGREIAANRTHSGPVNAVAFSCDDRFAASGGYDNTVQLWEFDWDYAF
jgi:WD40 repeat protein